MEGSNDYFISYDLDSAIIGSIQFKLNIPANVADVKIFVTTESFETRELVIIFMI